MQVQKIFDSYAKQLAVKPKYQKPVYKSYRELLQLDRPRKQIEYESSSSQQDFLQKLLNQQQAKARQKRKKQRKSTRQSAKQKGQKVKIVQKDTKKQADDQHEQKKPKNKFMSDIEEFLALNKKAQIDTNNQQQKVQQVQSKASPLPKTAKSKSSMHTKNFQRYNKSKQMARKDILLKSPIFIDTKSVITPPITHTSANHMFATSLKIKNQEAYQHLISLKSGYQKKYSHEINPFDQDYSKTKQITHIIQQSDSYHFTYSPNIEPLNPNWRINLTINPLAHKQKKQFPDRKVMFKSQQQQQRFIRSLSQFRSIK